MWKTIAEINKYWKLEKLSLATLHAWQSYICMFDLNILGRTPLWLCKKEPLLYRGKCNLLLSFI